MRATFASDNAAGVSPEILAALHRANTGPCPSYGDDEVTAELGRVARGHFGEQAQIWPVFNGTGANVVALQAALPRWGAVVCTDRAHIATDEGAAPERLGAIKLLTRPAVDAKLVPADVEACASAQGFVHAAQPLAVSITQSTETGTLYTPAEVSALAETAHAHGMVLHVDGARLANAAVALGVGLGELTSEAGVDVLSFGGTKNGALAAEAVVVIDPQRLTGIDYIRKFSMQLASKQRFIAAQLLELLGTDLWWRNAAHANSQAQSLGRRLGEIPGIVLSRPTLVNATFPEIPERILTGIRGEFICHRWDTAPSGADVVRLMCSWETTDEDLDALIGLARRFA